MKRLYETPEQRKRKLRLQKQLAKLNIENEDDRRRAFNVCLKRDISPARYNLMLAEQQGKFGKRCPICGEIAAKFHLDHDHETGRVRMFLCNRCNSALGLCYDDPDRLIAMLAYLKRFGRYPHIKVGS